MDNWLETGNLPVHFIAAGGLVYKENKVLLIKSKRRGWEFPGGVIEQGESILEGLKREILEESGIVAEPISFVGVYQNLSLKKGYAALEGTTLPPVANFDFICTYVSGIEQGSDESIEAAWVTPEEAKKMVKYPGYVERLSNMLDFDGKAYFATFEKNGEQMRNFRQIIMNK